ncbi:MAG: hypothetical protein ACXWCM_04240 [Acidimicrobiales bacterium]
MTSATRSGMPRQSFARSLASGLVGGYDVEGPRVRLGLLWLVSLIGAIVLGGWALGLLMGLVAGAAGSQSAAAWRRAGRRPHQIVAGLTGLVMPLAAALGTGALGLVAVLAALAALAGAASDRRRHATVLADAGLTLRCGFVVGLAGASLVVIHRLEIGAAVCLVLLMCAYDVGDFLVGTGASTPAEGPIAGIAAVLVVTFAIGVFAFPPFDWASAWVFGGMAAAMCPLGQVLATAMLPTAESRAPSLRRVDSLLLVGPLWAWALWGYLA